MTIVSAFPLPTAAGDIYSTHPEYEDARESYELLDDVMAGSFRIKSKTDKYLPVPNPTENSVDSLRYQQYLKRAIFTSFTKRMARTLVGLGYLREPKIKLPDKLKFMEDDVDGTGLSLIQLSKAMALEVMVFGRAGILTDFPNVSSANRRNLGDRLRPYLKLYRAAEIPNWNVLGYRLQFVTLRKQEEVLNGYSVTYQPRWRILEMSGGNRADFSYGGRYMSKSFSLSDSSGARTFTPLDYKGKPFERILFQICGAANNTWNVDPAPMLDVATLNIGHFINSADAEEISYKAGQPFYVFSGLDERQVKSNAGAKVEVGSGSGVTLGQGGDAKILQASENSAPRTLMLDKVLDMEKMSVELAVGSRSSSSPSKPQTATEVATEGLIRNSVLISALQNVSLSITKALKDACLFVGADSDGVEFEIDTSVELGDEQVVNAMANASGSKGSVQQRGQVQQPSKGK